VPKQDIEVAQRDLDATLHDLKTARQEFGMELAAVEVRTRRAGGGITGTSTDREKPTKLDGSVSWAVFHSQLKVVANHELTSGEKATHLLVVLEGKAAGVLVSQPERHTKTSSLWRVVTETTSWQPPTGTNSKPAPSSMASQHRRLQQLLTSWRNGPLLGYL
jgi:hypothetical protein